MMTSFGPEALYAVIVLVPELKVKYPPVAVSRQAPVAMIPVFATARVFSVGPDTLVLKNPL